MTRIFSWLQLLSNPFHWKLEKVKKCRSSTDIGKMGKWLVAKRAKERASNGTVTFTRRMEFPTKLGLGFWKHHRTVRVLLGHTNHKACFCCFWYWEHRLDWISKQYRNLNTKLSIPNQFPIFFLSWSSMINIQRYVYVTKLQYDLCVQQVLFRESM